ncbi:hypothetical protein [Vulcaniibacterium tengchongense]|uniref:Uncharacterized protein n=1 Tax=Vulcaniibacterium tengchongense TaxID=1273429 RepID=A0A3N4VL51_9GAMM|nr:hypothetical protein [Vulcaniibacterium tengchongense]RPE74610.1 hypothetical protein EDC50_3139 [Vulcaniibacterium tengchongense]
MRGDLTPPDADVLPPLPARFGWQLPHAKQHRRPYPETRQIVVDGEGPALAAVSPKDGLAAVVIGLHRALEGSRHYRTFASRDAALRYVAAWAWKYADQLIAEIEEHRCHRCD